MKKYTETENFIFDHQNQTWIFKNESNVYYSAVLQEISKDQALLIKETPNKTTWEQVRLIRNSLLKESDWVALSDATSKVKQKWMEYRQTLRDITNLYQTPDSIVWPTKPE